MPDRFDVVLLPTFTQVEAWRARHAATDGPVLFAQTITTFNAWVADLWELHGDGRRIVDSLQRRVVMQVAFEGELQNPDVSARVSTTCGLADPDGLRAASTVEGPSLTLSPGVVDLAAKCVKEASGIPAFERALDEVRDTGSCGILTQRESVLLAGIARYRVLLESAGFVELGEAAAYLAGNQGRVFSEPLNVLVDNAAPLNWIAEHFLKSCTQLSVRVQQASGADGVACMPEGVGLEFGFPSGRYAQPALVADLIRSAHEARSCSSASADDLVTVVACKDPLSLYKQLEPALAPLGLRVCVQAQVPFDCTDFGRRFTELFRVVSEEAWLPADLSDAVRPPFSGFNASDVLGIDKGLRSNRLARRDACLAQLRMTSDVFSQLEELVSDPDADVLLGVFEQIAYDAPGRSAAWRREQLSAASAVRACTSVARRVGASMRACAQVLENVKISVSYEGVAHEAAPVGRVLVTTQAAAAQMGEGSCAQLILCDLTSEDYPVADKDDSASTLFAKLGLNPTDSALARARRTFRALQALARARVVCMRPLNDWDGNPTYPCAVLQELVDAYDPGALLDGSVDDTYGLPHDMLHCIVQRGEELLYANAKSLSHTVTQQVWGVEEPAWNAPLPERAKTAVALPRRGEKGVIVAEFCPSPSQVEAYLECPRKWFVQSRLNVEELDEGFGALERGSFAHTALQRFYARFQEEGFEKVLPENLGRAKELMSVILDELEDEQYELEPKSGRYVALTQIERREIETCKEQVKAYLDFEAQLLPNFHPRYLEYKIKPEDGVMYAGRPFIGIVDRIDVDDAGNAVVIDYKGSVGKAHQIAGKTDSDPGKVQTRMYAQVIRRALGLNVVGALYVSYGKAHGCAGAFDSRALESAHLPDMKVDACACALAESGFDDHPDEHAQLTFSGMLDRTERVVAEALNAMESGDVAPAPTSGESCSYCPATTCPLRNG